MARKAKGEVARSETLGIRLDPKTRYMLELAGRIQHRTLSSVVEWMINNSLKDILVDDMQSLANVQADLWDIDEPDRLVNLAFRYPSLLSFDEQKIWKVIKNEYYFWGDGREVDEEWVWNIQPQNLKYKRVQEKWEEIKKVALSGESISFDF